MLRITKEIYNEIITAKRTINTTEKELAEITSKILLNIEFEKAGDTIPYDYKKLHAEAQELRTLAKNAPTKVSDKAALFAKNLFPIWNAENTYIAGDRVVYNKQLYKAITDIALNNETWTPDVASTLWQLISNPSEKGTIDNPITAEIGLLYEKDKYYNEGNKIYLCIREDTEDGTALYYLPSSLVGVYFEEVTA
jgi:hypothetical protein